MTAQHMRPDLPWPVVPSPPTTSTAPWWDATRNKRLVVQSCGACHHLQLYPRAICTACGSTANLDVVEVAGTGRVLSHSTVHRAPDPRMAVPYVIAIVELDEGPRLLTRLWHPDVPVEAVAALCDVHVRVAWVPVEGADVHLPIFVPELTTHP